MIKQFLKHLCIIVSQLILIKSNFYVRNRFDIDCLRKLYKLKLNIYLEVIFKIFCSLTTV